MKFEGCTEMLSADEVSTNSPGRVLPVGGTGQREIVSPFSVIVGSTQIARRLENLPNWLTQLDDRQIIELALNAQRHQRVAFLIRAACAYELQRRSATRLSGGRGKKDRARIGIQAQMNDLAERLQISLTTLRMDARIYDKFFSPITETVLAREHCLAREFYVIALSAPDPRSAIQLAMKCIKDPSFNREQFKQYVRTLKSDDKQNSLIRKAENIYTCLLRLHVSQKAKDALDEMTASSGKGKEEIISEAILSLHQLQATARAKSSAKRDKKRAPSHHQRDGSEEPLFKSLELFESTAGQ